MDNYLTKTDKYCFFLKGHFSQWWSSKFFINKIEFKCAEQFMMAEKALIFNDQYHYNLIMKAKKASEHKDLGRQVTNFNKEIWDKSAKDIVYKGNLAKFKQNIALKEILLETHPLKLVEVNPRDKIWGIGLGIDDPRIYNEESWQGLNWLGEVLTKVREDIYNN